MKKGSGERFVIICVQPTPRLRAIDDGKVDVRAGDTIEIGASFWTDGKRQEVKLRGGGDRWRVFALFLNREDSRPIAYTLTTTYVRCFVTRGD